MRRSPVPAYLIALLALVVALGGGAYAATKIPKSSVGTKQLKSNAVTTAKVKNGSLTAADFAAGQLTAGPPGPQGPKGADGQAVTAFRSLPAASTDVFDILVVPGLGKVTAICQLIPGAGQPVRVALSYVVGVDDQRVLVESDGAVLSGAGVFDAGQSSGVTYPVATAETGNVVRVHVGGLRATGGAPTPYAATFSVATIAKEGGLNQCSVAAVVTGA